MEGEEASFFVLCNGQKVHRVEQLKTISVGDGDTGPNTGGMGAITSTVLTGKIEDTVIQEIINQLCVKWRDGASPIKAYFMQD